MSVKLINQHVNDGSYFSIFRIHKAMDATPPVAGKWKPSDVVNLVAVLFPKYVRRGPSAARYGCAAHTGTRM